MRRMGVILGHPIFTCFLGSTGYRRDPRVLGRHNLVSEPRYAITCSSLFGTSITACHVHCNTPKYTLDVFDMFRVFCKLNLNVS